MPLRTPDDASCAITVDQVSKAVIAKVAPGEAGVLDVYLVAYSRDTSVVDAVARPGADSTGFGEYLESTTPYVVALCHFTLHQVIISAAVDTAKDRIRGGSRFLLNRMRKPQTPQVTVSTITSLTSAQLNLVRERTERKALQLGLADDTASVLADAVIGSIVEATS
ncbi:hypothetical protein [Glycomyces sp. NRRL B-16210]|uniref:hypothetical protein n=1 Tax=Glycomyces sp. NRRL B-16210 TaxID=1463821 RepID=UPI0014151565|nr:hypothetical protein [Glycomyces sp. NRRL B-16210]